MHVVLRSEKATGRYGLRLPKNWLKVDEIRKRAQKDYGIEIAEMVNAGKLLQFRLRAHRKEDLQNFLRVMTCLIAREITGAKKGSPFGRFWDGLSYTRVLKDPSSIRAVASYFRILTDALSAHRITPATAHHSFALWRFTPLEARAQAPP
ncbi:MAG: hypothetical protein KF767_03725 [Bdellovibrionaceae bacterium]|nr:hypothetical protein [Pseudobdellovibrionaceae bacterium]